MNSSPSKKWMALLVSPLLTTLFLCLYLWKVEHYSIDRLLQFGLLFCISQSLVNFLFVLVDGRREKRSDR